MNATTFIFYFLGLFILCSAILAVTANNIFRSAIWLLFTLIGIAGLYFWLSVEFIAAVQIVVYVGGIVVLIIFSIFLTQQSGKEMPKVSVTRKIFSTLSIVLGFTLTYQLIVQHGFEVSPQSFNTDIARIGEQMLSTTTRGYALPFEVVSMLLLAAMVGCIVIAMKSKPTEK